MLTILCAAVLATPQDVRLDRVPFQPDTAVPTLGVGPATDGAFLGVGIAGDGEARITSVVARSAAEVAGFRAGDVIVSIAGSAVAAGSDVSSTIASHSAGETIQIVVRRGDDEIVRDVVLGRRSEAANAPTPGVDSAPTPRVGRVPAPPPAPVAPPAATAPMQLAPARPMQASGPGFLGVMAAPAERGLAIASVNPGGPAERAGLLDGDVILEVGGDEVASVDELVERLARAGAGRTIAMKIERDGSAFDTQVVLGARPGAQNAAPTDGANGAQRIELHGDGPQFFSFDGPGGVFQIEGLDLEGLDLEGLDFERIGDGHFFFLDRSGAGHSNDGGAQDRASDAGDMADMQREFRQRFNELRDRHRAEMDELQSEMREMFEAHGMRPQVLERIERRNAQGGAGSGLQIDQDHPLQGGMPGGLRLFRSGTGPSNAQGEQRIIEMEVRPDGSRVERSRRAELRDGQWQWVEENVDELPPQAPSAAPGARGMAPRAMLRTPGSAAPGRDPALEATIADLRRQIDELEKRAAELLERRGS